MNSPNSENLSMMKKIYVATNLLYHYMYIHTKNCCLKRFVIPKFHCKAHRFQSEYFAIVFVLRRFYCSIQLHLQMYFCMRPDEHLVQSPATVGVPASDEP